jgi:hypothetical protein
MTKEWQKNKLKYYIYLYMILIRIYFFAIPKYTSYNHTIGSEQIDSFQVNYIPLSPLLPFYGTSLFKHSTLNKIVTLNLKWHR